jgi:hypothetical protein
MGSWSIEINSRNNSADPPSVPGRCCAPRVARNHSANVVSNHRRITEFRDQRVFKAPREVAVEDHDPENEKVIEHIRSVANDVADLRNLIMQSEEYRRKNVATDFSNFAAAKLQPPQYSVLLADFAWGWHGPEGTAEKNWRWSSGDAKIVLYNSDLIEKRVDVRFRLATIKPRSIKITFRAQTIHQTSLVPGLPQPVDMVLTLVLGTNELRFATDAPADFPSKADARKVALMLHDWNISEQSRGNLGNTGKKSHVFGHCEWQTTIDSDDTS